MPQKILYLLPFLLAGCIGSYIVHDDTSGFDYGNLATVPERPQPFQLQTYHQEIDRLKAEHQSAYQKNEELRKLHQKDVKVPQ